MSLNGQVRLVAASVPLLHALKDDRALFGELIGSPVPDGWPEFPEAIAYTLEHAQNTPERDRSWSMQFFIDDATGRLLGSGGFATPPADRTVEIGYEIAPDFRGKGFGTAAARALVRLAVASGEVDNVVAHTLRGPNPSTGVLVSLDFAHVADQEDPEVGVVWEWRWTRSPAGSTEPSPG
jgi:ribosomal-protein-alanine N-acetyltransferase